MRPGDRGTAVILSANPIHDTGGGQRSAQLALELLERDWTVVFVSHGRVTETVDLGLRYDHPGLAQWSLDDALAPEGIETLFGGLGGSRGLVVTQVPVGRWLPFLRRAADAWAVTVYDCIDRWASELGRGWYRKEDERQVAEASALLTASAPALVDHVEELTGRETTLLPNAFNARLFDGAPASRYPRPASYPADARVALYVGALWGGWMDWSLARRVAESYPDTTFVFVGDRRSEGRRLPANCVFVGLRPQSDLPAYLAHADVGFLPWRADDVTGATSPLKVYEFVAMGLPVVAPAIEPLSGIPGVRTEASATSFVRAMATVGRTTLDDGERAAMGDFARNSSWERRVDDLLRLAESHGPGGGRTPEPARDGATANRGVNVPGQLRSPRSRASISVVVPAHDHERWVGEALDSVSAQTLPAGEIVVVDDGSSDASADVAAQRAPLGVRLVRQANRGAHHALNRGIRLSRGDWIAILNSDDAFEPERLEHAWGVARETGAALVFGSVRLVDGDGEEVDPSHEIAAWYAEATCWAAGVDRLSTILGRHNLAVTTSNVFMHRSLWEELGGFRSYRYVHDYDFLLRAVELVPGRVVYEPALGGVLYRVHDANTITEGGRAHGERRRMIAALRRPRPRIRRLFHAWGSRRALGRRVDASSTLAPVVKRVEVGAGSDRRIRAGLVVDALDLGGLEEVVGLLALTLPAAGVGVSVLCVRDGGAIARRLVGAGVSVTVLGERFDSAAGWVEGEGVDVVSSHFAPVGTVGALADARVPIVETVQNCYAWLDAEGWATERERVGRVAGVIAVSDTVAAYYRAHTGRMADWTVPNAVHPARASRVPRAFARRALDLPEDARVLAFVGRITEQKNPSGLLDAFAMARGQLADAVLVMAGPAEGSAPLSRLRRRHPELFRSGAVRRIPSPRHVGTVLSGADAFVSNAFYEGWSVAASEALWVGRPVILSETGGAAELVGPVGARGVLVPNPCGDPLGVEPDLVRDPPEPARSGNVEAMADAMVRVLTEADTWSSRGGELRSWARSEVTPEVIADRYAEILRKVAGRR